MIPTDSTAADVFSHGWHDQKGPTLAMCCLLRSAGCVLVPAHIYQAPLGMGTGALISRGLWQRVFAWWLCINSMLTVKIPLGQDALPSLGQPWWWLQHQLASGWFMSVSILLPAGVPSSVSTEGLSVAGAEPTALLGLHQPPSLTKPTPCLLWESSLAKVSVVISGGLWCCTVTPRQDGLFLSFMAAWVPWGGFAWSSDGVSRCQVK